MISIKSKHEIQIMKENGKIMREIFDALQKEIKPGISTQRLNDVIKNIIEKHGATSGEYLYPSFYKGVDPFPGHACISVNDQIIHGVPSSKTIIKEGDIVTIDLVIEKNGFYVDCARTFGVGKISQKAQDLIDCAKDAFFHAMKVAKEGNRIGDISNAVETFVKSKGFDVIKEYQGHGIGRSMHEDPGIPNYGKKGVGLRLKEGMTLAVEPMIVEGSPEILELDDGWTVVTEDGLLSAHYENTILVTKGQPIILT